MAACSPCRVLPMLTLLSPAAFIRELLKALTKPAPNLTPEQVAERREQVLQKMLARLTRAPPPIAGSKRPLPHPNVHGGAGFKRPRPAPMPPPPSAVPGSATVGVGHSAGANTGAHAAGTAAASGGGGRAVGAGGQPQRPASKPATPAAAAPSPAQAPPPQ